MVPVGVLGKVTKADQGGYAGWYVRVEDDVTGFLILFIRDPSDPKSEGYDQWAGDEAELARRLRGLEIDWGPQAS